MVIDEGFGVAQQRTVEIDVLARGELWVKARAELDERGDVARTVQVPSLGSSTPAMILSMVDLPEPLVPTRPTTSPRPTLNEMCFKARNSLKNSSWCMILMKYSLRLVSDSEAMLKTMLTSLTSMA